MPKSAREVDCTSAVKAQAKECAREMYVTCESIPVLSKIAQAVGQSKQLVHTWKESENWDQLRLKFLDQRTTEFKSEFGTSRDGAARVMRVCDQLIRRLETHAKDAPNLLQTTRELVNMTQGLNTLQKDLYKRLAID